MASINELERSVIETVAFLDFADLKGYSPEHIGILLADSYEYALERRTLDQEYAQCLLRSLLVEFNLAKETKQHVKQTSSVN